ncbi:MAPEG family protein [Caballeronia sp. 15715]|uniref:MAPEG family protein n=1 Tax=unclassified Caballeronia TaxID=2646786 RepID=UPI0039E4D676
MKLTPELYVLALIAAATALMWIPYMLARIVTRGVGPTLANPADPAFPPDPAWAERARCAHANAVANLAVFAPLVIILALTSASTPVAIFAAKTYLGARLVHYIVYAAGVPVVRTLAFVIGAGATLVIAAVVVGYA